MENVHHDYRRLFFFFFFFFFFCKKSMFNDDVAFDSLPCVHVYKSVTSFGRKAAILFIGYA